MTAFITVARTQCPLTRAFGYSVSHATTGDACWASSEADAIGTLTSRLRARGYLTYSLEYVREVTQ